MAELEALDQAGLIEWSANGNPRKINYADESDGMRVQDVWLDFKDPQYPVYPTEKNASMLDLIIQTSSNPDSIILDCYCGSGTTLKSAEDNGRSWIGIDQSEHAIRSTTLKLSKEQTIFSSKYEIIDLTDNFNGQTQPIAH